MYRVVLMMAMTASGETPAFASLSPTSVVILLGATASVSGNDLVSLIEPEAYFRSRNIPVSAKEMVARADQEPRDGKAQLEQLLGLRWLADHAEMTRSVADSRGMVASIAEGKHGQDRHGFAKDYASRALARLDGKEPPPRPQIPADSLRSDAFAWFPKRTGGDSYLAGIDLRTSGAMKLSGPKNLLYPFSDPERGPMYAAAEALGNIRVDRASASVHAASLDNPKPSVRITGAFDHKRVAAELRKHAKEYRESTEPQGEPIALMRFEAPRVALALIGDTDLVLVAGEAAAKARPLGELEEVLEVRAGKRASVLKGSLTDLLKQMPDQAIFVAVGEISNETRDWARKEWAKGSPPLPQRFAAYATRDKAISVNGRATMSDVGDAGTLEKSIRDVIGKAREELKAAPPSLGLRPETLEQLNKALNAVKA
jgi:hypothetical protein